MIHWNVFATQLSASQVISALIVTWFLRELWLVVYNVYFHPLSSFPGPWLAAATPWWKTYQELYKQMSFINKLVELHAVYGDIVRIGPNELHFSRPSSYHEIYNSKNRWDKEKRFYRAFAVDDSSFGFLAYHQAKQRKDVLSTFFSRTAIIDMQSLVQEKIDAFCDALRAQYSAGKAKSFISNLDLYPCPGKSSDLFYGFRCFTLDTITSFCFAKSVDALKEPEFKAPMIESMEAMLPTWVTFRHFKIFKWMVLNCPPWLSLKITPQFEGALEVQTMLEKQVREVSKNPKQLEDAPHPIIYHDLLSPAAQKGHLLPTPASLVDEAKTLVFGGSDTIGTALVIGVFQILEAPRVRVRLEEELRNAWPVLEDKLRFEVLEKLPYLTAVIKEILRINPGIVTGLPRIVPSSGTIICDRLIPGGTVVSQSSQFVHHSESLFPNAGAFSPERWLQLELKSSDNWLVPFSKGPRMCLGINLAYCELYMAIANIFRLFELQVDGTKLSDLTFMECFIPHYRGRHLRAFCKPVCT